MSIAVVLVKRIEESTSAEHDLERCAGQRHVTVSTRNFVAVVAEERDVFDPV